MASPDTFLRFFDGDGGAPFPPPVNGKPAPVAWSFHIAGYAPSPNRLPLGLYFGVEFLAGLLARSCC